MYVLHILTHGRFYSEEYDTLEDAIDAALALEGEVRERPERITCAGDVCLDRLGIEALIRERAQNPG